MRKKHHELINDGGYDKSGFSGYSEDDTDSENSSFVGKRGLAIRSLIRRGPNFPETKPENYQVPILSRTRVRTSWTPLFFTLSLNQEIRQGEVLSFWRFTSKLQNQNSLLVKRQNDNWTIPYRGIVRGKLVPSSHKGSKFRYTIVRQFMMLLIFISQYSRGDERIRENIPVPDSLGKETFLVGIFTSSGNLKDQ